MTLRILPMSNVVSFYARESRGNGKKGGWLTDWNGLIDRVLPAASAEFSTSYKSGKEREEERYNFSNFYSLSNCVSMAAGARAKRPNGP